VTADEYCRQKAAPAGSSSHYAYLFLPPERRRAVTALHAFCREVEYVVDEVSDAHLAQTKLAWWRQEVGKLFEGSPSHPITRALLPATQKFPLQAGQLHEIIEGVALGLTQTRYLDFASLAHYCHHTAGAEMQAAAGILGYANPRTAEYARKLGTAFRLTRVIREVGADARRNRIYLPIDELKKFDVPAADILQARHSDNFAELMKFQAARVKDLYQKAFDTLPPGDRSSQRAGLTLAAIRRATLAEVERDGFQVLAQRTSLTPLRKFWLAWKTWVIA
jgi:phytoene synthase